MSLLQSLTGRFFDALDHVFDATASIWRVLLRGAFEPDSASFRGHKYHALSPSDILIQRLDLNAADRDQARKAIMLEPDRYLPLSLEIAEFDVVGPLDDEAKVRARPERVFLLGVIRKDALPRLRAQAPAARRGVLEGFVFAPSEARGAAMVFTDSAGKRRRRFRRSILALALCVFGFVIWDVSASYTEASANALDRADEERMLGERRVRLAERRLRDANATLTSLSAPTAPPLDAALERLDLLARHLPADAELNQLTMADGVLALRGRAFDPAQLELELRRSFESDAITFNAQTEGAPVSFEAQIRPRREPASTMPAPIPQTAAATP